MALPSRIGLFDVEEVLTNLDSISAPYATHYRATEKFVTWILFVSSSEEPCAVWEERSFFATRSTRSEHGAENAAWPENAYTPVKFKNFQKPDG